MNNLYKALLEVLRILSHTDIAPFWYCLWSWCGCELGIFYILLEILSYSCSIPYHRLQNRTQNDYKDNFTLLHHIHNQVLTCHILNHILLYQSHFIIPVTPLTSIKVQLNLFVMMNYSK